MAIICFLKSLWRSATSLQMWTGGFPISGHNFTEMETHENCDIQILICDDCKHYEIGWEHNGKCNCNK